MLIRYLLLLVFLGNSLIKVGSPRPEAPIEEDPKLSVSAPHPEQDAVNFPPCKANDIPHYTVYKIDTSIQIDGKLDEAVWLNAPQSSSFRDLISGENAIHKTRAAVLWDDEFLYVGYWIEEPNLQATLTERDAPIYTNNDVELFIAGKDAYYEFEINAYGLRSMGDDTRLPPRDKDVWRMDFSRFNQYKEAPPANDSGGWAWSPHGVWDSHVPECFTYIHFSENAILKK